MVLSADGKGVPLRKPADAPAIAAHDHSRGPKPDRKKMAVLGVAYPIDPHARTPLAVVAALFRDPAALATWWHWAEPRRPVPHEKWGVCVCGPRRGRGLGPPRPVEVIFPWLQAAARRRYPTTWFVDGMASRSLREGVRALQGQRGPAGGTFFMLHATLGYPVEAVRPPSWRTWPSSE